MKHLTFICALLSGAIILACSPPSTVETACPDGSKCIAVDCTSNGYSHTDCLIAFGKACSSGYDIVYDQGGNYLVKCKKKEF